MSAVSGLNDSFLISIVETAKDFIADPNYSQTILTFLNMLLEEASKSREFCLNKDVLCKLKVLHDKIRSECQVQDAFLVLRGMIDPLLQ